MISISKNRNIALNEAMNKAKIEAVLHGKCAEILAGNWHRS